jgi:hypothetical protein
MEKLRINFAPAYQQSRDIEICVFALGRVYGSREAFMPHGEMATDAFDMELDAAWDRLTPRQQLAVISGAFTLFVPKMYDADRLAADAAHQGTTIRDLMRLRHEDEEDFDERYLVP